MLFIYSIALINRGLTGLMVLSLLLCLLASLLVIEFILLEIHTKSESLFEPCLSTCREK